jgi:hypothetical protein
MSTCRKRQHDQDGLSRQIYLSVSPEDSPTFTRLHLAKHEVHTFTRNINVSIFPALRQTHASSAYITQQTIIVITFLRFTRAIVVASHPRNMPTVTLYNQPFD